MATYITLIDWTDQGIGNFRDTVDRATAFEKLCEQQGARVKDVYWCLGEHDIVAIVEAPDDETATALFSRPARWATSERKRCAASAATR